MHVLTHDVEDAAKRLAGALGMSIDDVLRQALAAHEAATSAVGSGHVDVQRVLQLSDRIATLPVLDNRTADEILGYDAIGVPQ